VTVSEIEGEEEMHGDKGVEGENAGTELERGERGGLGRVVQDSAITNTKLQHNEM